MILAIHTTQGNKLVCVTDSDILGKRYVEGKLQVDLTSDFYKGEERNKEEIVRELKSAYVIHFTGKQSVALGIELDLVAAGHILTAEGVPHAEVVQNKE